MAGWRRDPEVQGKPNAALEFSALALGRSMGMAGWRSDLGGLRENQCRRGGVYIAWLWNVIAWAWRVGEAILMGWGRSSAAMGFFTLALGGNMSMAGRSGNPEALGKPIAALGFFTPARRWTNTIAGWRSHPEGLGQPSAALEFSARALGGNRAMAGWRRDP